MKYASLLLSGLLVAALPACMVYDDSLLGDEPDKDSVGGSGSASSGGSTASGGETSSGGSGQGSGGDTPAGGTGGEASGGASGDGGAPDTGGTSSGGSSSGGNSSGGAASGGAAATEKLIDDLEHADEAYLNIPFVGTWRVADDKTAGGTWTSPVAPAWNSTPFATTDRGAGNLAVHAKANGFTDWGVDMYVSLQETQADGSKPYDASEYNGIYFWAKADSTTKKIKVSVEDATSHVSYAHIGMDQTVTGTWARYELSFEELEFGKSRSIERDKVYAIHFSMSSSAADFWIDDVGLYK